MIEQGMAQRNRNYSRSGLSLMHPDSAGIDIGSAAHFVAVPAERDDKPVREFASFTADLTALAGFDFCVSQLLECDSETQRVLQELHAFEGLPAKGKKRNRSRNAPKFDVREHLFKVCGVDLTRIDGIDVSTALVVLSEIGSDLSRFPTVKHFTSWLGQCPGTRISGGRVLGSHSKRTANRATQALKLAAAALRSSKSALAAYYQRLCARMDKPKAVTAAARKLARLIYMMLTKGEEYTDQGKQYFEERYRERVVRRLTKRARELELKLVPSAQTT
jgi:transposase